MFSLKGVQAKSRISRWVDWMWLNSWNIISFRSISGCHQQTVAPQEELRLPCILSSYQVISFNYTSPSPEIWCPMAQLFRVTNSRDASHTSTFTFLLPPQTAAKDGPPEILSREFAYFGHQWRLCLSKKDGRHLSPYLDLCSPSPGLKV